MRAKNFRYLLLVLLFLIGGRINAKIYLVSVGVADYSGYPYPVNSLRLTAEDAKTIAYIYSKNSNLAKYSLLLNEKATKENIILQIETIFSNAMENDLVVFFFSGHGYNGGFCAYNGEIGYEAIRKAMAKSKCKNKMMFADACMSGAIRVDSSNSSNAVNAAKNANVLLFLSSRTDEYSMERTDMKNGFFTTYLQKALRGNADANRDRKITARELFKFVYDGVIEISNGKQHPVMWGKFKDNMPVIQW